MFSPLSRANRRINTAIRRRDAHERKRSRQRQERRLLIERFEERIVLDSTLHMIAAANLDVVQKDAANNESSVVVTAPYSINDFRVRQGSNRGDFNIQVGSNATDDATQGILMTSISQNGRDNSPFGDPIGIKYATSAIAPSGGTYFIPVFDAPGGSEHNTNVAAAWFPYADGWLGGYGINTTNGSALAAFVGNEDLSLGVHLKEVFANAETQTGPTGKYIVDLREFDIYSTRQATDPDAPGYDANANPATGTAGDGVLLVTGAKNEDNYSLAEANADGTWTIYNHDNGANGAAFEADPISFVYVPRSDVTVVSGRFNGGASPIKPIQSRPYDVTRIATGRYELTIAGYTPADGVLIISAEGGASGNNSDNTVTYQATTNSWIIETRDITGMGLQNIENDKAVCSFIFIPGPEDAGVTVSPTTGLLTSEIGGTATFNVVLNRQPAEDVVINLASSDSTEGTLSVSSLTFTALNWYAPQTVTVTGVADGIPDGPQAYQILTTAVSADADFSGVAVADVSLVNIDANTASVVVAPTTNLVTTEAGGNATFSVVLSQAPASDVIIDLASDDESEGTLSAPSLTFTSTNWSTPQLVTVTGVNDNVDDGDIVYSIVTSVNPLSDATFAGLAVPDVAVKNTDDDTAGMVLAPTAGLVTTEAGATSSFTITLSSEPTANVVITVASSDVSEGTTDVTTLTFTPANWTEPQTVTINGVDDLVGDGDVAYSVNTSVASSDPVYAAISLPAAAVINIDNEPRLALSSTALRYGVLDAAVGVDGVATVSDTDTELYAGGELTFQITAIGAPVDLLAGDRLIIRNDGGSGGYIGVSGSDVLYSGLVIGTFTGGEGTTPLVVALNGNATRVSVEALIRAVTFRNVSPYPTLVDRVVTVTLEDGLGGTSNAATRTIRFGEVRMVEFQQNVDRGYGTYADAADVQLTQSSANTVYPTGGDANGLLVDWPDANESNSAQVLIRYSDLFGNNPGQIPYGAKIVSATLTVNTNNPGDGGTIHRMLVDWNANSETWNSFASGLEGRNTTAGVQTDGVEAITVNESQLGVVDGSGSTGTGATHIGVTADLQAWANGDTNFGWLITGWPSRTDGWAFSPSEAANYLVRPLLSVEWVPDDTAATSFRQGVDGYSGVIDTMLDQRSEFPNEVATWLYVDAADEANETQVLLRFNNIIGSALNQIPAGAQIHSAVLTLAGTNPEAMGDGGQFYRMMQDWYDFTATWASFGNGVQPNGIEAATTSNTRAGNASLNPNVQATFNTLDVTTDVQSWVRNSASNYGWAIVPWAGGIDDWGFTSSDAAIEAERPQLRVYYTPAGVTITPTEHLVTSEKGESAQFSVVLNTPPTHDVTFNISSNDATEGTVSNATLTFTAANWNVPQIITVTGQNDPDADGTVNYGVVVSNATSADPAYNGKGGQTLNLRNVDDDSPSVFVKPTGLLATTEAGDTANFSVVLYYAPLSDVTISLASSDVTEGTAAPATLTFTTTNWATPQIVTVTGVNDFVMDGDLAYTIVTTITTAGADYLTVAVDDVAVTNLDDDVAGVTVTPTSGLETTEAGGTATFNVVLDSQPAAGKTVRVGFTSTDTSEGTVPNFITFTDADWNTPQTVTITGVDDGDNDNNVGYKIKTSIIATPTSDANYALVDPADVLVTNIDNENVAPVLTLPRGTTFYGIGTDGIAVDSHTTLVDTDPSSYAGGTLTLTLTHAKPGDSLSIRNDGTGAGQVGVAGSEITYGGVVVGTFVGGTGAPLVVTFNGAATPAIAQAVARVVVFSNSNASPDTTVRTVQMVATDGLGGSSNTATKSIVLGPKQVSGFQEGVDWGYGTYNGAADMQLAEFAADTPLPVGGDGNGLLVDWPDNGIDNASHVLLRYDDLIGNAAGQIPLGAQIVSAQLIVYTNNTGDGGKLHRMLKTWDANAETWNSFGDGVQTDDVEARASYDSQVGTVSSNGATGTGAISIGVTTDVQAWANGDDNFGWAMLGWSGNTDGWAFSPSEANASANRPLLLVEWLPGDVASQSFRQGVDGYTGAVDTRLVQSTATTNYAASTPIWSDAADAANESQFLMRFEEMIGNGLKQIPTGSTIHAAVLTLSGVDADAMGDGGKFHTMLQPWNATDTWSTWVGGIHADGLEAATTFNTAAGNATLNPDVQGGFNPFDVTADVQAWVNGTANYGWAVLPWAGGTNGWGIASAESVELNYRPQLRVYYTPAPGVTIDPIKNLVASEGGSNEEIDIALTTLPTANVTVTATVDAQAEISVDGGTTWGASRALVFTSENGLTAQKIIVRAIDDAVIEGNHASLLTFVVSSTDADYNDAPVTDLSVAIVDNDMLLVEEVVVNDGDPQRSMITEVNVRFNAIVSIGASAFAIINRDSGMSIATSFTTSVVGGKTVATIRFLDGASVESRPTGNSLADGNYQLTIDATQVSVNGMLLDGDGDGTAGGNHVYGDADVDNFYRLYGDVDGDWEVSLIDLYDAMVPSYGSLDGDATYKWFLDADGDNEITLLDLYDYMVPSYGKFRDISGF